MVVCVLRRLALVALLLGLSACASTTIQSAWYDQAYHGGAFRKVIVVGVGGNLSTLRVFEDIFAAKLAEAGVQGVPGYQIIPSEARFGDAVWNAAVEASGADGLISVRLLNIDTRTQVQTVLVPAGPGWGAYGPGWGGWGPYGPGWYGGAVAVPEVTQYDVATVEANLWDVRTRRVVYAATTTTINPTTVAQETPGYASLIIDQLSARSLLATGKK